MLYLSGLLVLDLAVLALGAAMLAAMDLDKAGTLGVLASVPVVLLVLSDFPIAHVALLGIPSDSDERTRRRDRRTTVLLAGALTAAGAAPLLLLTAAADGPIGLALSCSALAALALVYAFGVGDRVAARQSVRPSSHPPGVTLVRRRSSGVLTGRPVPMPARGGPARRGGTPSGSVRRPGS